MKIAFRKLPLGWQLFCVFGCAATLMLIFESIKSIVLGPNLTLWQSHSLTVVVSATFATIISIFVRKVVIATNNALSETEEKLARSESRAILSTLSASVSHELNSPIGNSMMAATTLSGLIRTFRHSIEAGTLKRSELNAIIADIDAAATLIERNLSRADVLLNSFRQVSADQASEQRRPFDLAKVVQEILFTLSPSLKRSSNRIAVNIPAGITMNSQPGALGQIIINLINNAYLHGFENRNDGILNINAELAGDKVRFSVSDDGTGMTQEAVKKMFQPYFSTKIGRGGTGLGMTIVKNLVEKTLGGALKVTSSLGQGTRIEMILPLISPQHGDEVSSKIDINYPPNLASALRHAN